MNTFMAHLHLHVKPDNHPRFLKAMPAPFALREPIEKNLSGWSHWGLWQKVTQSKWAAPIMLVPKLDCSMMVCGDYKTTINQYIDVDQYPLPKPDDLFATLVGGQQFTKIELIDKCLLTVSVRQEITVSDNSEHLSGVIPVHKTTFWCSIHPSILPKRNGYCTCATGFNRLPHLGIDMIIKVIPGV